MVRDVTEWLNGWDEWSRAQVPGLVARLEVLRAWLKDHEDADEAWRQMVAEQARRVERQIEWHLTLVPGRQGGN